MSNRTRTSELWQYFTYIDSHFAKCDICKVQISHKSTMSNLKKHMERKHPLVNLEMSRMSQAALQTHVAPQPIASTSCGPMDMEENVDDPLPVVDILESTSSNPRAKPLKRTQLSLHSYVPKKISLSCKKTLDDALLKLFYVDCRPFSMVEDKGFKEFVSKLNPAYTLPSRKTLSKTSLPFMYEKCLNEMKIQIKEDAISVCLTTDCWTSINNQSFIALTAHYIDKHFNLKSVLLECTEYEEKHTSLNLSTKIQSVISEWGLDQKIILVISDNAYNIKGAITILDLKHFGCFAHSLNLIVQNALKIKEISRIIDIVKSIVGYFKRSSNALYELDKYQKNNAEALNNVPKKLIQDVTTRWNSTFYMLGRFIELEKAIKATLAILNTELPSLSPTDWKICKELCLVLKPFEEVTRAVSGENYMGASLAIVLANGLMTVTEKLYAKDFDLCTTEVILELKNGLNKRFSNLNHSNTLTICTFLDPRFKQFVFSENIANQIKTKIINATTQIVRNKDDAQHNDTDTGQLLVITT